MDGKQVGLLLSPSGPSAPQAYLMPAHKS